MDSIQRVIVLIGVVGVGCRGSRGDPVPPLQPGESPPTDMPNYFEPTEPSSGAVVMELIHCRKTMSRATAPLAQDAGADPKELRSRIDTFCECDADAFRQNYRHASQSAAPTMAGDHLATEQQMMTCAAHVNGPNATPRLVDPVHGTARRIDELDQECRRTALGDDDYVTGYCACYVDMIVSGREQPGGAKRCAIAARYRAATQKHATLRQFRAIEPPKDG